MIDKIKTPVFRNSVIYMATDSIARAIGFLLLPITSKYLVPEQLGIAANFDVLQSILALLAGQAIVNALPYFYYKSSKEGVALLVSSLIGIILILNLAFSGIIYICSDITEEYLKIGLALQMLTAVSVISQLLSDINKVILRLEDKPYQFAGLQLLQSGIYTTLLLILLIGFNMQALGRIYSTVFSLVFVCFIHVFMLIRKRYLLFRWDMESVKKLLRFGIPLLPHSISFWIKSGLDKVLLTTFCGLAINGLYSMAMTFGAIYSMCQISFSRAYVPYLQKKISTFTEENEFDEKLKLVRMTYGFGGLFIILYFVLVLFCWFVVQYVINEKYLSCFQFIPWILLARTLHAFYSLVVEYIYTAKKTLGLGIITFTGSFVQLAMTYSFIQLFGLDGIKISIVVGELVIMIGVWWYSNRVYPLPWMSFMKKKAN